MAEDKDAKVETSGAKKRSGLKKEHKDLLLVSVAVLVVALAYGIGYGAALDHNNQHKQTFRALAVRGGGDGPVTASSGAIAAGGHMIGGEMGSVSVAEDGAHFNGVVTAISGNNFTIGGSGASTSVVTSSSTTYQNGNTVKLNDSVIIIGTKSGDTVTATKIVINP